MLQRSHHNVHFNSFLGQNKENMQGCAQFWLFDVYSGEQPETLILRIFQKVWKANWQFNYKNEHWKISYV